MGGRRVRVLCVVNRVADNGGAEVSTVQLLRVLQGDGLDFGVATLYGAHATRFRSELEAAGVAFFGCGGRSFVGRARSLRAAVRAFRPDLLHSTLADSDLLARAVGALERVPRMSSLVNPSYSDAARAANGHGWRLDAWRAVDGWTARHGPVAFHALTVATAGEAVAALGIDPRRVRVVPRGRDRAVLGAPSGDRRFGARRRLGIAADAPVLLNVARQVPQKGQVHLVEAFARLLASHPRAELLIAGRPGGATPAIERAVAGLGVSNRVRLLGVRDDVGDLLCAADVFAFSSLYEGFGGALAEAMAMGVPVAAFDVPAVREVVGEAGLLVPAGDPAALAAAIERLLAEPATRRRLGQAGQARFEARYTIEATASRMRDLYLDVARASGRAAAPA